jgi:hypothetical protein
MCLSSIFCFCVYVIWRNGFCICLPLCSGYLSWEMDLEIMWFQENEINAQSSVKVS